MNVHKDMHNGHLKVNEVRMNLVTFVENKILTAIQKVKIISNMLMSGFWKDEQLTLNLFDM